MRKVKTIEMEVAVAKLFNPRQCLIVPNVDWGFPGLGHEADLLILRASNYLTEVEIKISLEDLKADLRKAHNHESPKLRHLFFAVPFNLLEKGLHLIPSEAGIIVVEEKSFLDITYRVGKSPIKTPVTELVARKFREPVILGKYKVTPEERYLLARLGTLRIFPLKKKLVKTGEIETKTSDQIAVNRFASEMLEKLKENSHKEHWSTLDDWYLLESLERELAELGAALSIRLSSDKDLVFDRAVISECADVANFAMMIADNVSRECINQKQRRGK